MTIETRKMPFSVEQEKWYAKACSRIDAERLKHLLLELINIPSPTGAERRISEFTAAWMREHIGGSARYQPISEDAGNAIGEIRGGEGGATLHLHPPARTHQEGDAEHDLP